MRRNVTQAAAGAIFGCSQPTVSRRWDLLRPVIGKMLAQFVPDPAAVLGRAGTALVDAVRRARIADASPMLPRLTAAFMRSISCL